MPLLTFAQEDTPARVDNEPRLRQPSALRQACAQVRCPSFSSSSAGKSLFEKRNFQVPPPGKRPKAQVTTSFLFRRMRMSYLEEGLASSIAMTGRGEGGGGRDVHS